MVTQNRKRIGILFNFGGSWLGGVYYIQNIIKALNYLDESQKPIIFIFYNKELAKLAHEIRYPYIERISWDFISTYKGYFFSWITQRNLFVQKILDVYELDGIYPLYDQPVAIRENSARIVSWFPDLQHRFFPQYFSRLNLFFREIRLKLMLKNSNTLVVSSCDVANHFNIFYKIPRSLKIHVLPFVSIIDDFSFEDQDILLKKYHLPKMYFIVSNQFYEHKNHIVVFKAIKLLQDQNFSIHVVFTGKVEDYRNPKYKEKLYTEIIKSGISDCVSLLGVIPREDQLCLLKNAVAVIQPSFFEGWSTVIEDAKSLQVPVICSEINVHREQLGNFGVYFNPKDCSDLAQKISSFGSSQKEAFLENYTNRVRNFAQNFVSIFD